MGRTPRFLLVLPLAVLLLVALSAPAEAAKRKVPFGFFGTVLVTPMSGSQLDQQMALMARSGVEVARANFRWDELEPAQGVYNWASTDELVAAAARHRIHLLANAWLTPEWASSQPNGAPPAWRYPPRDPGLFGEFVSQLVKRYGPRGSFWAQNPSVPRVPIREWQIWNEQMAPWFWTNRPWQRSYTPLLKSAYRSIHRSDRGAKVVAGSLVAIGGGLVKRGGYTQMDGIRDLYRAGARRYFDVIAIHPFTNVANSVKNTIWQTLEILRRVRKTMRRHRDGRKPIIVTELTWPAALGKVPSASLLGLETTRRGQVARLKAIYPQLARERRKLRVTEAYWYAWATEYDANSQQSDVTFRFTGLTRFSGGVFSPMPLLRTYATLAARYEGCRKSSNARRCR
jgi:hypothetical protein